MKGYRFYLEHHDAKAKREGKHDGNVVALFLDEHNRPVLNRSGSFVFYEGYAAVYSFPNAGVNFNKIDPCYLREHCKRISEAEAREIHPALFARLEEDKERERRYRETH
jgi:hypothetical protein